MAIHGWDEDLCQLQRDGRQAGPDGHEGNRMKEIARIVYHIGKATFQHSLYRPDEIVIDSYRFHKLPYHVSIDGPFSISGGSSKGEEF